MKEPDLPQTEIYLQRAVTEYFAAIRHMTSLIELLLKREAGFPATQETAQNLEQALLGAAEAHQMYIMSMLDCGGES